VKTCVLSGTRATCHREPMTRAIGNQNHSQLFLFERKTARLTCTNSESNFIVLAVDKAKAKRSCLMKRSRKEEVSFRSSAMDIVATSPFFASERGSRQIKIRHNGDAS